MILSFFTSCSSTRYLDDGEKLLFKQNIRNAKNFDRYTLEELYVSRPNRRFPPYAAIYNLGLKKYDESKFERKKAEVTEKYESKIAQTDKEKKKQRLRTKLQNSITRLDDKIRNGNTLMQWGEPVAVYDSTEINRSRRNFENYIFNRGYFNGKVDTKITESRSEKKVSVEYIIKAGQPYRIDTFFFRSPDPTIMKTLLNFKKESFIREGEIYRQQNMVRERERLEFLMKDHGYFDFSRQYISFDLDTGRSDNIRRVAIRANINQPSRGTHKQYRIDSMNFIITAGYETGNDKSKKDRYNDINFNFFEDIFSPKMLDRRIYVDVDSLYSRSNTLLTQRQLANLNNFKFINVNYDSSGGRFIANIFTRPLDRYQWSHELGANATQGIPGIFYSLSFIKRNIFKSFENFEISGRYGIDGVATPTGSIYRNREFGVDMKLYFPQFIIPRGGRLAVNLGILNPQTRLQAGFTNINRSDYQRENITFANTLNWEGRNNDFYAFSITELGVIRTGNISDGFQAILDQNSRLQSAFNNSFVTDMSFTFYRSRLLNEANPDQNSSRYFRARLESGGTLLNLYGTGLLENEGLEYFKYLRIDVDYSQTIPVSRSAKVAYRLNLGVAAPYGENRTLPYEKFFFAGGSSGIRAWAPRRLGPGSYTPIDPETNQVAYTFEQQGEILLQASFEYRKDLIGFTEYALFIDAGNIWNFYNDASRPGGQFSGDFYKQIAVGSGLGLRFDFSFLVLRLDIGVKTLDPARPFGKRFILNKGFFDAPFDTYKGIFRNDIIIYNIGVGYPF